MGHYSTTKVLFEAGADPNPPTRLFRNIWDSNELKRMVKHLENYVDLECLPRSVWNQAATRSPLTSVLIQAAAQFTSMEEMSNAEALYRRVLEMREKSIGVEHPQTFCSVKDLARVLQHQGKYEAAEKTYRRALEISEKMVGRDHPNRTACIYGLASLFHIQKRYDEASVLYLEASEGLSKMLNPDHPMILDCSQAYSSMIREMESQDSDVQRHSSKV